MPRNCSSLFASGGSRAGQACARRRWLAAVAAAAAAAAGAGWPMKDVRASVYGLEASWPRPIEPLRTLVPLGQAIRVQIDPAVIGGAGPRDAGPSDAGLSDAGGGSVEAVLELAVVDLTPPRPEHAGDPAASDPAQFNGRAPTFLLRVGPGPIDLASIEPGLWRGVRPLGADAGPGANSAAGASRRGTDDVGEAGAGGSAPPVRAVQLLVDGEPTGPALLLEPLMAPSRAQAVDARGLSVRFAPPQPRYFSGLRVSVDQHVKITTDRGVLTLRLRPDAAPNTAANFRALVAGRFYDGLAFHRVVGGREAGSGFVIHGGDPLGNGQGGPGYTIALEESFLPQGFGVVSMARRAAPDSAGSQFFIALSDQARTLQGAYAAFAQAVGDESAATLRAIAATPVGPDDAPLEPVVMRRVELVDAPPLGRWPAAAREPADPGR